MQWVSMCPAPVTDTGERGAVGLGVLDRQMDAVGRTGAVPAPCAGVSSVQGMSLSPRGISKCHFFCHGT